MLREPVPPPSMPTRLVATARGTGVLRGTHDGARCASRRTVAATRTGLSMRSPLEGHDTRGHYGVPQHQLASRCARPRTCSGEPLGRTGNGGSRDPTRRTERTTRPVACPCGGDAPQVSGRGWSPAREPGRPASRRRRSAQGMSRYWEPAEGAVPSADVGGSRTVFGSGDMGPTRERRHLATVSPPLLSVRRSCRHSDRPDGLLNPIRRSCRHSAPESPNDDNFCGPAHQGLLNPGNGDNFCGRIMSPHARVTDESDAQDKRARRLRDPRGVRRPAQPGIIGMIDQLFPQTSARDECVLDEYATDQAPRGIATPGLKVEWARLKF